LKSSTRECNLNNQKMDIAKITNVEEFSKVLHAYAT
jgi:hypothetical protein